MSQHDDAFDELRARQAPQDTVQGPVFAQIRESRTQGPSINRRESEVRAFFASERGQFLERVAPSDTIFIEDIGLPLGARQRRLAPGAEGEFFPGTRNISIGSSTILDKEGTTTPVGKLVTHEKGHQFAMDQFEGGGGFSRTVDRLYRKFLGETGLSPEKAVPGTASYSAANVLEFEAETFRRAVGVLSSPNEGRVRLIEAALRKDKSAEAQATTLFIDRIRRRN